MELQRKQHTQKKILALEASFNTIKEATHANDLDGVRTFQLFSIFQCI